MSSMAMLQHRPSQAPRLAQASACGNRAFRSRCVASRLRVQAARAPSTTNNQLVMAKQQPRLTAGPRPPKAASLAGDIMRTSSPGLSSSQGAVVLMGTAAVMAVTADAGLPGLVAVTGLAGSWLYPAEFAALAGFGTRVGQVVTSHLRSALGLNRPAPSYNEPAFTQAAATTTVTRVEEQEETTAIVAEPVPIVTTHSVPQALPRGWGLRSAEPLAATATSASAAGQPSAVASAHAAAQLAKRGSVGKVTLAAQCLELPLRADGAKALVSIEQLLYRGGISVASTSPEVLARKRELLAGWRARAQAEGGDSGDSNLRLPRVEGISSVADVFSRKWSALRLFVETPQDWGIDGAKVATWGDLKVVAAYGIAAGESAVPVEASVGGGSVVGGVGAGGVSGAEGAVIGAGAYVVAAGGVAAAGAGAAGAAGKSPRGPAARKQRRKEAKKQASKGFGAGKLLRAAVQAVPLVAAVLAAKVSLLVDAF